MPTKRERAMNRVMATCDRIAQRMGGRFVERETLPMTDTPEAVEAWLYTWPDGGVADILLIRDEGLAARDDMTETRLVPEVTRPTDTPCLMENIAVAMVAAKLMGTVNAPEQEIYRVSRAIVEMIATRPADDLVRQLVEALAKARTVFAADSELHWAKLGLIAMQHGAHSPEFFNVQVKIERNRDIADMCEEALTAARAAGYGGDHG